MSASAVDSVKVRMYRHGFGDCFLLSFLRQQQRVFSILIDCGIKHNTRSRTAPIEDVVDDLRQTLMSASGGKPKIDVLAVTHEHWDHVAFFHPTASPDFFRAFDIGQIWLAWTEDPQDAEAVTINSRLREGAAALQIAATRLHNVEAAEVRQFRGLGLSSSVAAARTAFNSALNDVLGYYGVAVARKTSASGIKYKPNGKISVETEVAMTNVIKLGKKGGISYLNPGTKVEQHHLPPGVNAYVLGPPRSSLINQMNPSKGSAKETYLGIDHTGLTGFIDGVLQMGASPKSNAQPEGPFGNGLGLTPGQAKSTPYFKQTYFAKSESYRQIEHTWLDVVSQFSLQLDGAINNTSLVIAIELEESGKVLLFPGDAQVGSWLSWHACQWKVKRGDRTETITATDLLRNTVLYKVSHHGSHNATVKDKGLELMTHPELVAMIPEKENSYNGILYKPLMDHLLKRCKGRVLVSADIGFPPEDLLQKRPPELSAAEWKSFKADLTVTRLFVEYTIR
jgi:hypothetical protein